MSGPFAPELHAQVVNDLITKCADDVLQRIKLTCQLLPTADGRVAVALGGCASALGLMLGFIEQTHGTSYSREERLDDLLAILRGVALGVAAGEDPHAIARRMTAAVSGEGKQ